MIHARHCVSPLLLLPGQEMRRSSISFAVYCFGSSMDMLLVCMLCFIYALVGGMR